MRRFVIIFVIIFLLFTSTAGAKGVPATPKNPRILNGWKCFLISYQDWECHNLRGDVMHQRVGVPVKFSSQPYK